MKLISGLAAVALAATTLAVTSPASAAETAGDRSVAAGTSWLKSQLTDGIVVGNFDGYIYDDYGLSADIAFAFDAVGGQDATVTQIADAVSDDVTSWYDSFGTTFTGSAAKAIALAQVADMDATSFGGVDLQDVVEDNVATTAPIVGRVQNANETEFVPPFGPTDSLNVISQSWAARGLGGQGSDLADEVMAFLLDQQCDDGSFRSALTKDKTATEQGCATGATGEVDTTALTVLNILATPDASVTAKGAAYLAASWLKTQQAADGSFSAGSLGVNSNTTGLAGWALAEAGYDAAATKAAAWLRGLQVADLAPCATTLAAENGALAYKAADLASARTAGAITVPAEDGFRRATAQALPAMASLPAGGDVAVTAPATAVEKSTVTLTVTGLGAGEPGCVSFGSESKKVTGTGSPVQVTFTLPAGSATHTFRVATLTGSTTATTAATLTPAPTPTPTPTPAEPTVGDLAVAKVVKVGRKGAFKVAVECDSTVDCTGKVKVRTVGKVKRPNGSNKVLLLAKASYDVEAGETAKVTLKLTRPALGVVGKKRIRVVAVQTSRHADPATTKFWLRRK